MTSLCTRATERDAMFLMANLFFAGNYPDARVKVRNLSSRGMMVECDVHPRRGTRVVAELRNIGLVPGVVAWANAPKFGIAFDKEIEPKLARTQVYGGHREAPSYARATVDAPRHDSWNGKLRRV